MTASPGTDRSILLVTPCRDEADHIDSTIETVANQTLRPTLWIIVDDGSTDDTPQQLAAAQQRFEWISVVPRVSPRRNVGAGVVEAFREGLSHADLTRFAYICKLDADLELPPHYFERVVQEMEADPTLGNFSGKVWTRLPDGRVVPEPMGNENAIGAAKFYRTACYKDIGGFVPAAGWDGIDGHMCRLKGWRARSEDREDLRIVHRRLMGSSQKGVLHGRARWGRAKWFMGSTAVYMLAVATYRIKDRPFLLASMAMLVGYFRGRFGSTARLEDAAVIAELRSFEWDVLLKGRAAAIRLAKGRALRERRVEYKAPA